MGSNDFRRLLYQPEIFPDPMVSHSTNIHYGHYDSNAAHYMAPPSYYEEKDCSFFPISCRVIVSFNASYINMLTCLI